MANIQQAARWLNEGKKIRRPGFGPGQFFRSSLGGFVVYSLKSWTDMLEVEDLLAEDWEIYE